MSTAWLAPNGWPPAPDPGFVMGGGGGGGGGFLPEGRQCMYA